MYQFAKPGIHGIQKFKFDTFDQAKSWVKNEIDSFKLLNGVKDEENDRYFQEYRYQLLKALYSQQAVNESDMGFGKDVSENIKLAKERRESGFGTWKEKTP